LAEGAIVALIYDALGVDVWTVRDGTILDLLLEVSHAELHGVQQDIGGRRSSQSQAALESNQISSTRCLHSPAAAFFAEALALPTSRSSSRTTSKLALVAQGRSQIAL
jgi:exopolyphosphatase/pppGpp-phosphohydrolase